MDESAQFSEGCRMAAFTSLRAVLDYDDTSCVKLLLSDWCLENVDRLPRVALFNRNGSSPERFDLHRSAGTFGSSFEREYRDVGRDHSGFAI